jgi:succinate dehydrogenase / fumarate reductase cytochrome b subunit
MIMSERPLSPHLQVYRWALTMTLSILHRATGAALAVGILMVVWMLVAAADGEVAFMQFHRFAISPLGQLMLFGWSVSLFYHAANGIRHLFWDAGIGYEIKTAFASGWVVLLVTALLTASVWLPVLMEH